MSALGFLKSFLFYTVLFALVLTFAPGIPPYDTEYESFHAERVPFVGPLEPNNDLDSAQFLSSVINEATFGELKVKQLVLYSVMYSCK